MNPFDLLKQFGNIQEKMKEAQERFRQVRVTGSAGGDMVQVELNGNLEVLGVRISPEAITAAGSGPAGAADLAMLEDLVRAAFSDALGRVKEKLRDEMSAIGGGLNLPPGLMGF